jgi:hypothetical protein
MHADTTTIPLDAIVLDWGSYPRERVDLERVEEFRDPLRSGEGSVALPPVELVPHPAIPGRFLAAEGWHRIYAHAEEGLQSVRAILLPPETDVFAHAVARAAISAKPLTRSEKRAAVLRLLAEHPEWSNHRIAETAGVSRPFVADLRAGGNVAPDGESQHEATAKPRPDYALRAMRSLIEAYQRGDVRTKLGFGSEVSAKEIRRFLERLDDHEQDAAIKALRAWRVALGNEQAWLPGGEG